MTRQAAAGLPPAAPDAPRPAPAPAPGGRLLDEWLFTEGYAFNFFQAVRLLERLDPSRRPVGRGGRPGEEVARFRAHLSLSFPASQIYDLERPAPGWPAAMAVTFLGLTGPSGVLPVHYTELLLRLEKEAKGPEKRAFRDWLDLFNHRLISLFYRSWEKYRFYVPYERGEYDRAEPDGFTRALLSYVGLGSPRLRNRLRVAAWEAGEEQPRERVLGRVDDLALLHYGGYLAHRPRNAASLRALVQDYFGLPAEVRQFHGQWLVLGRENQSSMNGPGGNNQLGVNVVAGERVWDVQGKFRVRLGPLGYQEFCEFLPDRCAESRRKTFFLLCHLVRLYAGPDLDFDVQLVLRAADVPACRLGGDDAPRLGWNTWVTSRTPEADAEDAAFDAEELVCVNPEQFPWNSNGS